VLAPSGRDGELAVRVLSQSGITAVRCADTAELRAELRAGVGALLLTEEVLTPETIADLAEVLGSQLPWSDLPVLVFAGAQNREESIATAVRRLAEHAEITLIDRPTRKVTLISAVESALRARSRQYEVRDLLLQLENGVRERDRFLAMLSHELRNPLAAIQTAIELMERKDAQTLTREREVVSRQIRVLSRLVDDLLDLSRLTLGKIVIAQVAVDATELVERCVQAHRPLAENHGIELSLRADGPRFTTRGDSVRLEQVLNNLLANALKYTPRGGHVAIRVSVAGGMGEIRIQDDGIGIDSRVLPRIFDPFTQDDDTIDRSKGGLGIGLTLVRHLVQLHGGTVSAESAGRGAGSTFVLRLPVAKARVTSSAPALALGPAHPRRILVIEDNPDLRDGMKGLLEQVGHEVLVSSDGEDGVAKALARRPDVILVDIGLPKLDGYKVAERLRHSLSNEVMLVAVSGYGSQQDRLKAFAAGFDFHLTKPITLKTVLDVVERSGPRASSAPQ
jgi:signal transduction histidine kinase/ActR/RegA family two-component response regulator